MIMTCTDCERNIEDNEEYCVRDKSGKPVCLECGDYHADVTMVRKDWDHQ
jgi:NAD-dependent SIR2 family protein deacetylase